MVIQCLVQDEDLFSSSGTKRSQFASRIEHLVHLYDLFRVTEVIVDESLILFLNNKVGSLTCFY